jgi:hypothetical protein
MAAKTQTAMFRAGAGPESLSFKLSATQAKRVVRVLSDAKAEDRQGGSAGKPKASKKKDT